MSIFATVVILFRIGSAAAEPDVLPPVGKWVMEGRDVDLDCVLSRDFGARAHPTGIAIRPSLTGYWNVSVSFETPRLVRFPVSHGTVAILPDNLAARGERSFTFAVAAARETLTVTLSPREGRAFLANLDKGDGIRVEVGDRSFVLATGTLRGASTAMKACLARITTAMAADPAAMIHAPGERTMGWIRPDDLTRSQRASLKDRRTTALLTIRPDGSSRDCRTIISSGLSEEDSRICDLLHGRVRYDAEASVGAPADRHAVVRVGWTTNQSAVIPVVEDSF